ncbi:MAG: serine/threonine-protein kinase [Steroidobacteraceae bacterium]
MTDPQRGEPHWAVVQALLNEALAYPPEDRASWLLELPTEHESIREILRQLLEARAAADGVTFPDLSVAAGVRFDSPLSPGEQVGPYRLIRELGSGGMGAVWLAERSDGQLRRKFALKLPRMVWAEDLATRMARERDILVSLEHPHIARLYDAGLDDKGRPYLALEYIEGERLDTYCDSRRLDLRDRVRIFRQVLDAVQYAHTQLIIHRDLKAANVLVNARGSAVLLDFGIASLVADIKGGDGDAVAQTVSRAMTPRCASPEQLQESRLTLASDIYSLGVLLFELLAGELPYITSNSSRTEFERAIIEGDVQAPSRVRTSAERAGSRGTTPERLSKSLRGDLDAIVLKAIQVAPKNRYASVEAFSADLGRWLDGHPVLAAPPSRLDRISKFVRRNTWSVGITSTAAMLVLIASGVAINQSIDAASEAARTSATNKFLLGLFEYANPELHNGRDITARELLLEGERRIGNVLDGQPDIQANVLAAMADVWVSLDDIRKVQDLITQRTKIFAENGMQAEYRDSLLDEAEFSFIDGDYLLVEKNLMRLRSLSESNNLPRVKNPISCGYVESLPLIRKTGPTPRITLISPRSMLLVVVIARANFALT